jgi:hypothetical protein
VEGVLESDAIVFNRTVAQDSWRGGQAELPDVRREARWRTRESGAFAPSTSVRQRTSEFVPRVRPPQPKGAGSPQPTSSQSRDHALRQEVTGEAVVAKNHGIHGWDRRREPFDPPHGS